MAQKSEIEWTDATWTVVQGCDYDSPGCKNCYAVGVIWRLSHNPDPQISGPLKGLVCKTDKGDLVWTGKLALRADRLDWPLRWRKPLRIFVPSHGDIFHEDVPDHFLHQILAVMAACPQHTFQVLTKRADRMRRYIADSGRTILQNVWLGVSVEDQRRADERIPHLLATPAAKRFLSCEPLLEGISIGAVSIPAAEVKALPFDHPKQADDLAAEGEDVQLYDLGGIDWVIVGGESGKDARPMHPKWVRSLHDECSRGGIPFFFKQWGAWAPADKPPSETQKDEELRGTGVMLGDQYMRRLGKDATGALLDNRVYRAFPA